MPAPLAHAAYGREYLKRRPELDRRSFMRGTMFPDIRKLAGLPRDFSHRFGVTMRRVDHEADAWWAGSLAHSYLDEAWIGFFAKGGVNFEDVDKLHDALGYGSRSAIDEIVS